MELANWPILAQKNDYKFFKNAIDFCNGTVCEHMNRFRTSVNYYLNYLKGNYEWKYENMLLKGNQEEKRPDFWL